MPTLSLTVQQRRLLAVALACAVALFLAFRHLGGHAAAAPLVVAPLASHAARPTLAPRLLVVDVAGAVRRPGLYRLRQGARVADAIERAGGLSPHAERTAVNLAAPLADGEQVLIAARGSPVAGAAGTTGAAATGPVSLNSASAEQLDALPGVGPVTAQKILQYRQEHGPFTSVDGLDAIPGIGPARLADLRPLVVP
ncbi:MAG: ComEA family DNA-binding protein [Actinomycetota bacterium]|nr:ComEA family DNA-binding protein [Actinomycetota bacterium]